MRRSDCERSKCLMGKNYLFANACTQRRSGARYYRICHFSRSFGGHRDPGNHDFQAEDSRTVDCDKRWNHGTLVKGKSLAVCDDKGQATVEFALVMFAFMGLCAGIASLWHGLSGGMFGAHILMAASHHVILTLPGGLADVFLY